MKKLAMLVALVMLLTGIVAVASALTPSVLIQPNVPEIANVEQGVKIKFSADWQSDVEIVLIEWLADGVVVASKKLPGKTEGTAHYLFNTSKFRTDVIEFAICLYAAGQTDPYLRDEVDFRINPSSP